MSNKYLKVLVLGAGNIGLEYARILEDQNIEYKIISRSCSPKITNANVINEDIFNIPINRIKSFSHIIIAIQPHLTFSVLKYLIENTELSILVEKPLSLFAKCIQDIKIDDFENRIYVAFNRRFFPSVIYAKKLLEGQDITASNVCITEMSDRIIGPNEVIERWGMANTIHILDLIFYLVGFSNEYTLTRFKDSLSNFDIHFIKKTGSLFIQSRNNSAGNWSIDITTKKHKIYMNPLETINVQKINEVDKKKVQFENSSPFKTGFKEQLNAFLVGDKTNFISYHNYKELSFFIEEIFKYDQ